MFCDVLKMQLRVFLEIALVAVLVSVADSNPLAMNTNVIAINMLPLRATTKGIGIVPKM